MIDIKPPDEPFEGIEEVIKEKTKREDEINKLMNPDAYYLKENSRRHGLFKEYVQIRRTEEYKSSDLKVTNDVLMEISLTLAEILDEMRGVKDE